MFCPKCGSILRPIEKKKKRVLGCSCGYVAEKGQTFEVKEKVKQKKDIEVVEEVETKPIVTAKCSECDNNKAYFWTLQTRAADEPETQFFKCTKCGHQWREYG
ncbi:transcription factor S [Nanoarchaeota archaeon]